MKLNIGAGNDILPGYVNLDIAKLPGVDIVHDVNKLPLPFQDNTVDEAYAKDIIEHIQEYHLLLKDLHRIMKPGATLKIMSPHFTSCNGPSDPSHCHVFAVRTFSFFCRENPNFDWESRKYYYSFSFSRLQSVRITFPKHFLWDRINEFVVNIHPKVQMFYELTGWSRLFPAENIVVVMVK
jgi:ubiquinone/menaquinone biosynthesis C-methylase UbiE